MPATYEPIATTTLSSATATITFSSIPSTYTDLRFVFRGTPTTTSNVSMRLNSDTGSNYSQTMVHGAVSTASSNRYQGTYFYITYITNFVSNLPSAITMDILSYSGSTFKTCLFTQLQNYSGTGSLSYVAGLYRSTAAINTVEITADSNTWQTGTTATLYGILKA